MRTLLVTLSVIALLACTAPAQASILNYTVNLDGAQAGTDSPGTGFATVTLDDIAMTLMVDLSYSGLLAPTTNAHIHCCASFGSNAGVVIPFVPPFVTGDTSGTFTNTFTLTPELVTDIKSFQSYINIHTSMFPAGEIRGQIVPEPATVSLFAISMAGLALMVRRKTWIGNRTK